MFEFPLASRGYKPPLSEFPISDQIAMHLAEYHLSLHSEEYVMSQGPSTTSSLMNLSDYWHENCCKVNLLVFLRSIDHVAHYKHPCLEDVLCVPQGLLWHTRNYEFLYHKCATQHLKRGGADLHKGETEEEKVRIKDLTEFVYDAADQVWLHRSTHAYPVHLWSAIKRDGVPYDGLVDEHEDKDGEHGIEDTLVVRFLDPRVVLHEVEEGVPRRHHIALHEDSLLDL